MIFLNFGKLVKIREFFFAEVGLTNSRSMVGDVRLFNMLRRLSSHAAVDSSPRSVQPSRRT